jgi:hypothetical protein
VIADTVEVWANHRVSVATNLVIIAAASLVVGNITAWVVDLAPELA